MSDEAELSRQQARVDLDRVVKLLRQAGVTQSTIAKSAGYTPGYLTQLLGEKYSAEKLGPSTISRLVKAASVYARSARSSLGLEDTQELDRLLSSLTTAYVATLAEVYGMDGEVLDHREAAQYQTTKVDLRLLQDITQHESYGVVQVSGAPGQGKTWTLANLARDAATTHDVVWVDFERLERKDDLQRPAHPQMGRDIRRAQQRYYWLIERAFALPVVESAGDESGPSPADDRANAATIIDPIEECLKRIEGVTDTRIAPAIKGLRRLLGRNHLLWLPRRGESQKYLDEVPDGLAILDEARKHHPEEYTEDDLAEDLCLLWCLADVAALTAALDGNPALHQPRKLLVLVDSPDRQSEIAPLLQILRTIATLVHFNPECRNVLIAVSKTESGTRSAKDSSTVRRWYSLEPFTPKDIRQIIAVLSQHGWFRDLSLSGDQPYDEQLIKRCDRLCGLNRRASCMYLDQCNSASKIIEIEQYLGTGEDADDRMPMWIEAWAQRVVYALRIRKDAQTELGSTETKSPAGDSTVPALHLDARRWLRDEGPITAPTDPALLTFAETFGLVVETYSGETTGHAKLVVPLLQERVCRRVKNLLDQILSNGGEA